jgi:adenylate kinase
MESGRLVPDDVTEGMVWDKLEGVTGGYILDGFPRTVPQGAHLDEFLNGRGEQLTRVIHVWVKPEVIVDRLSGRRSCPDCKATYHVSLNPPKVAGVCDVCGSALVQRSDDEADTIQKRLEVYQQETAPLIAFYEARGLIFTVDGNQSMAQVAEAIAEGLVGGDPA